MPLRNGLPAEVSAPWSRSAPEQVLELITTYALGEKDALSRPASKDIAWCERGTVCTASAGIVKYPTVMPENLDFRPFEPGKRVYKTFNAAVQVVKASPYDLNFHIPMIFDKIGNGWKLMTETTNDQLIDFLGASSMGRRYAEAGRVHKALHIASLFYTSMYTSASWGVAPSKFAYNAGLPSGNTNGIALFTDGTGADGTGGGAKHFANPTQKNSPRYQNLFPAYGSFLTRYADSLTEMTTRPSGVYANMTLGAQVTDTLGPTWMRRKFWEMQVQDLVLEARTLAGGAGVAAAITNPYSYVKTQYGLTEENFIGAAFGPRKFWICPQLDNHPYYKTTAGVDTANMTNGANGGPSDMWINISAGVDSSTGEPEPTWAKGAASSADCLPFFVFYGAGDPQAQSERRLRAEGDLDIAFEPGEPSRVGAYFEK